MSIEGTDHYFIRCQRPGCMAGFLGWGEKCPDCDGGWITIPEVKNYLAARKVIGYAGVITLLSVCIYFLFSH